MKSSKTEYRGADALALRTRLLELVVTTGVGPRVVSLRSTADSGGNLFLEFPPDFPACHGYHLRGGHRLWHSPEQIPRTYQPDDAPVAVRALPRGVALTQPTEERTGIRKAMQIELPAPGTVRVTHTLTNRGLWPVETAPWALTMLPPGGYGVIPLLPKGSHAGGDLLPTYSLVPWSYTDLSLPAWHLQTDWIGVRVGEAKGAQKLGLTAYPGWSAYWRDGVTFVKHAALERAGRYPDMGCAFETFTDGQMIELETLGILRTLDPGDSARHVENWTVLRDCACPDTPEGFAALRARVQRWLASL